MKLDLYSLQYRKHLPDELANNLNKHLLQKKSHSFTLMFPCIYTHIITYLHTKRFTCRLIHQYIHTQYWNNLQLHIILSFVHNEHEGNVTLKSWEAIKRFPVNYHINREGNVNFLTHFSLFMKANFRIKMTLVFNSFSNYNTKYHTAPPTSFW